ncbi:MAG: 50S ribosomal protein L28 [PVC group bacterium]
MSQVCAICGKQPHSGNKISRRGLAKKKGGVGKRVTGVSRRTFLPNLQKVRAVIDGEVVSIRACTQCIRSGKVVKP